MEARWRCRIMGMAENVSGKDSVRKKVVTEMQYNRNGYGGRGYVGQRRWQNSLEGR